MAIKETMVMEMGNINCIFKHSKKGNTACVSFFFTPYKVDLNIKNHLGTVVGFRHNVSQQKIHYPNINTKI